MKKNSTLIVFSLFLSTVHAQFPQFTRPCGMYGTFGSTSDSLTMISLVSTKPFIKGYTFYSKWKDIEPQKGVYDFSRLRIALNIARQYNQSISLAIFTDSEPDWLLNDNAVQKWYDNNPGNANDSTLHVVPWNPIANERLRLLLTTLASMTMFDNLSGATTTISNHPSLKQIEAQIPGMRGIRDINNEIRDIPGYNRDTLTSRFIAVYNTYINTFPKAFVSSSFFGISDYINSPNLKTHLITAFNNAFNNSSTPKLGFFAENLSCAAPAANSGNVLFANKSITYNLFQMLGSWTNPNLAGNNASNITACSTAANANGNASGPEIAMKYAYENFNTTYFEVYVQDFTNPAYDSVLTHFYNTVIAPACGFATGNNPIDSNQTEKLIIYPNPADVYINVKNNGIINNINIYDAMGKLMLQSNSFPVNIGNLSTGIYFARIATSKGTVSAKFVKQ